MTKRSLLKVSLTLVWVMAVASAAQTAEPAAAQTCAGDCNSDDSVAIDEIILGVRTLLGDAPIDECRAMDSDGDGAVTVNELVAAVTRALQGCSSGVPTAEEAALVASARVATEPILQFFDFQTNIDAALRAAASSRIATGGTVDASGCQQFSCVASGRITGTREDCCTGTQFSQFFSTCIFDNDFGAIITLDGLFTLASDSADVCTGAIPAGASFELSLSNFTQDSRSADGGFSHTFQELSESFEITPGGCSTVGQPDLGVGIRGDGHRFIDGELQQAVRDGRGNIRVDTNSKVHGLEIAVSSTQQSDGCTVEAALNGSLSSGDFSVSRQSTADFNDFHVTEIPADGVLFLGLNGTIGTDCLGEVRLSTTEPLRVDSFNTCLSAGRLETQLGAARASVTYSESTAVDVDFGADGSVNQHFATCADVPTEQCTTHLVGLCGACTGLNQCQPGAGCFPCSGDCSGNTNRCTLFDTFVPCEDGIF